MINYNLDTEYYIKECHKNGVDKGFWDVSDNIGEKIALILTELNECVTAFNNRIFGYEKKDTFEDELADVYIRTVDLMGHLDFPTKTYSWKDFDLFIRENHTEIKEHFYHLSSTLLFGFEHYRCDRNSQFLDLLKLFYDELLFMCDCYNVDIKRQIDWKMEYNKNRPKLHGKKF